MSTVTSPPAASTTDSSSSSSSDPTTSTPTTSGKTVVKHSLFSLGEIVSGVTAFIDQIKTDIEELKSGSSRIDVLEQTVEFLANEVKRILGEPDDTDADAEADTSADTSTDTTAVTSS